MLLLDNTTFMWCQRFPAPDVVPKLLNWYLQLFLSITFASPTLFQILFGRSFSNLKICRSLLGSSSCNRVVENKLKIGLSCQCASETNLEPLCKFLTKCPQVCTTFISIITDRKAKKTHVVECSEKGKTKPLFNSNFIISQKSFVCWKLLVIHS